MRFPRWTVPVLLRLLSLAGLTSAGETRALAIGFALSPTSSPTTSSSSQPRDSPNNLSLDLDFFVQISDREVRVPIMPLHLLGKKSWNVYNTANIERVRRDEAEAQAREDAEEQRLQEQDAARRMAILRGEVPPPLAIEEGPSASRNDGDHLSSDRKRREHAEDDEYSRRVKKPRRRYGENETDYEMRVASRQTAPGDEDKQLVLHKESRNAPITDAQGHISLFPPSTRPGPEKIVKNDEVEAEAARKKREYEDQYTMRFSNAAGFKNDIGGKAWYENSQDLSRGVEKEDVEKKEFAEVGKDVWGNEDPRRREREARRVVDSDPLAFMKKGAAQVRQVERERKQWKLEKEREVRELEDAERRRRKEKRRRRERERERDDGSDDELEGFRLDDHERDDRDKDERRTRRREREREDEDERRRRHKHHRSSGHEHSRRDRSRERHSHRDREDDYKYKHRRRSD